MVTLTVVAAIVYALAVAWLALYGLHSLLLLLRYRRYRPRLPSAAPRAALAERDLPRVLIQIPVYNERDVVERAVAAAAALDWPHDRLVIQLLDDSDDDTVERGAAAVARARDHGVDARHLRRAQRHDFKAGALAAGLACEHAPLVAIFDADFEVPSDWLRRLVPQMLADPDLAFVQSRWEHRNRETNALTRAQALGIDGHFSVEQGARAWSGLPLNYNGTGGLWRRAAIEDAGGWQGDTLTEDMDLSYRALLRGWRAAYREDVAIPGEIPDTLAGWRGQQFRWAKGSIETARKLLPQVWRSGWRLESKLAATLHLTHYLIHPLILVSLLAAPLALPAFQRLPDGGLVVGGALMLCGMLPPIALYWHSQWALQRRRGWRRLRDIAVLVAVGTGIAVNNTRAVWQALRGRRSAFQRTPKRGDGPGSYRTSSGDGIAELGFAAWGGIGIAVASNGQAPWLLPVLCCYVGGFATSGCRLLGARIRDALAADHRPRAPWPLLAVLGGGLLLPLLGLALRDTSWREEPVAFALAGLAMGAAYLVSAAVIRRRALDVRGLITVGVVAALALILGTGLWHSDDVNRYLVEAAQLEAGINPYAVAPAAASTADLVVPAVVEGVNHPEMTAIYPPLALAYHWLLGQWWPTPQGFQVAASLLAVVAGLLVLATLLRSGRSPGTVVLAVWNPVLPLFIAGEAHHDILMGLLLVAALWLASGGRALAAVATASLAALVKPFAIVVLPLLVHRAGWRRAWWIPPALAAAVYLPFLAAGSGLVASLLRFGGEMHFHGVLEPVLRGALGGLIADPTVLAWTVRAVLLVALASGIALVWRRWRGGDAAVLAVRFLGVLLLCAPTIHPWYFCALVLLLPFVHGWGPLLWTAVAAGYWLHGIAMRDLGIWTETPWVTAAVHLPAVAVMLVESVAAPAPGPARDGGWVARSRGREAVALASPG